MNENFYHDWNDFLKIKLDILNVKNNENNKDLEALVNLIEKNKLNTLISKISLFLNINQYIEFPKNNNEIIINLKKIEKENWYEKLLSYRKIIKEIIKKNKNIEEFLTEDEIENINIIFWIITAIIIEIEENKKLKK